jgi:hypothetical protein
VIPESAVAAAIGDEIAGLIRLAAFACGAGIASTTNPPIATRPNSFFMVVVLHMRERFTARPERATAVAVPFSSHALSDALAASKTLMATT